MKKEFLAVIGILLIVLQIVCFIGLANDYDGLYLCKDHTVALFWGTSASDLTLQMAFFAFTYGFESIGSSIQWCFRGAEDFAPLSANQYTSLMIRESLGCCDGGSVGLLIYDVLTTITFLTPAIAGILILILSYKVKTK